MALVLPLLTFAAGSLPDALEAPTTVISEKSMYSDIGFGGAGGSAGASGTVWAAAADTAGAVPSHFCVTTTSSQNMPATGAPPE